MDNKQVSANEARRDFRVLLNQVEHDGVHVTITRYNAPAVVIVPMDWYAQAKVLIGDFARQQPGDREG